MNVYSIDLLDVKHSNRLSYLHRTATTSSTTITSSPPFYRVILTVEPSPWSWVCMNSGTLEHREQRISFRMNIKIKKKTSDHFEMH